MGKDNFDETLTVRAKVTYIRYHGGKNGYKVALIDLDGEEQTITGTMPGLIEGGYYEFSLREEINPVYGFQFKVLNFRSAEPTRIDDIEAFLASGIFKGIGAKTAKDIVKKFGEDSYRIILEDTDKLTAVRGIGKKTIERIKRSVSEHVEQQEILYQIVSMGFSLAQASKIFDKFGYESVNMVKLNPYILISEIKGLGFKTVDKIAVKISFDRNSPERAKAVTLYVLQEAIYSDGNLYLTDKELFSRLEKHIEITEENYLETVLSLAEEGEISIDRSFGELRIYLFESNEWELGVIDELMRLSSSYRKPFYLDFTFDDYLTEEQREAVSHAFDEAVFILNGPAGSGKTTILKEIVKMAVVIKLRIKLAAPTGRAAARIEEIVGESASTVHRLLEYAYDEDGKNLYFKRNSTNPLDTDIIIVDESSMIDIRLFYALLQATKSGSILILIGDTNQLPPIGPGSPLKELIGSGHVNVRTLSGVFRQEHRSCILKNARNILNSEPLVYNEKDGDFFNFKEKNEKDTLSRLVDLVKFRIPNVYGYRSEDIAVISPVKKGLLGIDSLNKTLQTELNPNCSRLYFGRFAVGDKVMHQKNNYELAWINEDSLEEGSGVFNGDMGYIIRVRADSVTVKFQDGRLVNYNHNTVEELELAYAMTVHKSQGNEFDVVVFPSYFFAPLLRSKNLIYTAITRAKKLFVLVGNRYFFEEAGRLETSLMRNSGLAERIKLIAE